MPDASPFATGAAQPGGGPFFATSGHIVAHEGPEHLRGRRIGSLTGFVKFRAQGAIDANAKPHVFARHAEVYP
jgi:hypothetical protein